MALPGGANRIDKWPTPNTVGGHAKRPQMRFAACSCPVLGRSADAHRILRVEVLGIVRRT